MSVASPTVRRVVFRKVYSGLGGEQIEDCVVCFGDLTSNASFEENEKDAGGKGAKKKVRPWMKLEDELVDLEKEGGLRIGVLYDYLYDKICTGDWPYFNMLFTFNYPEAVKIDREEYPPIAYVDGLDGGN